MTDSRREPDAPRVLVIDDDPWLLRAVSLKLTSRGFRVVTAGDGARALDEVRAGMPDVVITDVNMPNLNGWEFVRQFRSLPGSALVPVIFLTADASQESRVYGFRLGADDYMPKPFRFDDIASRVENALLRRAGIEAAVHPPAGPERPGAAAPLKGTLAQIGLASLLTLLDMETKSGELALSGGDGGGTGRLLLRDGRVVRAELDRPAPMRNREAVYRLLAWSQGGFEFHAGPVEAADEIGCATPALLLEGARRADERGRG